MNELLLETSERKLRYEGPNYTADAVIIDYDAAEVLLIQRADTGQWAVPGGFIDRSDESSSQAAIREADEETGTILAGDAPLIFRGKVDDPRSNDTSWIETSAHLFNVPNSTRTQAGDDAQAVAWHNIGALPPLYGSHRQLIERGLDYLDGEQLLDIIENPDSRQPVEGGYMQYDKWIAAKNGQQAFVKSCPEDNPRFDKLLLYVQKEAGTMAHLRLNSFKHIPEKSILRSNQLIMDAVRPEDGWCWQAEQATIEAYVSDTLQAFADLETIPLPTDVFDIESSYESLKEEGWQAFDNDTYELLKERLLLYLSHFTPAQQSTARQLLGDAPALQKLANTAPDPEQFVLCHHDIRQSNLAWHPKHGVKIIDWSWAGPGLPGTDSTGLLIDLHKDGYDVGNHLSAINPQHCLNLLGFWLTRSSLPSQGAEGLREQQFISALSAYELFKSASINHAHQYHKF